MVFGWRAGIFAALEERNDIIPCPFDAAVPNRTRRCQGFARGGDFSSTASRLENPAPLGANPYDGQVELERTIHVFFIKKTEETASPWELPTSFFLIVSTSCVFSGQIRRLHDALDVTNITAFAKKSLCNEAFHNAELQA